MFFSDFIPINTDDLQEKLVMFANGAKYGQIVFMSGGAGSGKGFALKQYIEDDKFKVRDVDELKKRFLKLNELKGLYPELKGLDLRNAADVTKLHMFVKSKVETTDDAKWKKFGFEDKLLQNLLSDLVPGRLPNILFDITGKHESDFGQYIPYLTEVGYDLKNIHLVWVLTDFEIAYRQNLGRDRVVSAEIFLKTHSGAAKTMQKIIDAKKLPYGIDGSFRVIVNTQGNTKFYQAGDTYKGRTIGDIPLEKKTKEGKEPKPIQLQRDFVYLTLKQEGKPFRPESMWKDELTSQIMKSIPKNSTTVADLEKIKDEYEKSGGRK